MNTTEFQQKISSSRKPLVIDLWAPWCRPCNISKPIIEKLADEYEDQVEFLPINADDSQELLQSVKVFSIPTVIIYRAGKEIRRVVGAQTEPNYRALFDALAAGQEVKVPMPPFDRMLRLGAGAIFVMIGISTRNWLLAGIGGVLAFMGVYDRCLLWRAITGLFKRKEKTI